MARPTIQIDRDTFEGLCRIQCTLEEVAAVLNCSEDTVERWVKREYKRSFADVSEEKRGAGRASLRRSQFKLAKTNATMAIWLGKQYLGQRDIVETKGENTERVTIINDIGPDQ